MSSMRSLDVNLDDVAEAMGMTMRDMIEWYLDTHTGKVHMISSEMTEDDAMRQEIEEDDGDRYKRIDEIEPHEAYTVMEDFIATVQELRLRDRLSDAIVGKGAFRRFKNALMSAEPERERWFAFEAERQRQAAIDWLQSLGIVSTWTPPKPDLRK